MGGWAVAVLLGAVLRSAGGPLLGLLHEIGLPGLGLVVGGVPGAVDQRHLAARATFQKRRHRFRLRGELAEVARAKAVPLRRVVAEPLAQRGAGRRLLQPEDRKSVV